LWELKYAQYLDEIGVVWERNTASFPYEFEGKMRNYTPDFYLPMTDEYVEIKGYKTEKDEAENYRSGACGGIQGKSVQGTDGRTGGEHTEVGEGTALAAEDENTAGGVRQ
jgi:hypothetical protein